MDIRRVTRPRLIGMFRLSSLGNRLYAFAQSALVLLGIAMAFVPRNGLAGGMAFDAAGNLYLSAGQSVLKFAPDGTQSTFVTGLNNAFGLAFDHQGNLFVSDIGSQTIYRFAPDATRTTFVTEASAFGMAFDGADNLFLTHGTLVLKFTPDGTKSTFASGLGEARDLAFDSAGRLLVLDAKGDLGKMLSIFNPKGAKTYLIPFIRIDKPGAFALDAKDNIYLVEAKDKDSKQAILKFNANGQKSVFAEAADGIALGSIAANKAGDVFVFDGASMHSKEILKYDSRGARAIASSPDGQWQFQLVGEQFPEIAKVGEKDVAVDLSKDRDVPHASESSIVWAPDSKSFAFQYSPPHMSHTTYETVVVYQLHGSEWAMTRPLVNLESDLSQLAQFGKGRVPKKLSREHAGERDVLTLRKWTAPDTAIVHVYSAHSGTKSSAASYDFTVTFDAAGKWKIVQVRPAPAED